VNLITVSVVVVGSLFKLIGASGTSYITAPFPAIEYKEDP